MRILLRPFKRLVQRFLTLKECGCLKDFNKKTKGSKRIFYLGRTESVNLGDNAQHYCIKKWIKDNYPEHKCYMVPARHVVRWGQDWIKAFKKVYDPTLDFIVFQSGYSVQDLGGTHPVMHELICEEFPYARILMMPQTIFFQHKENKERVAKNHNNVKNMLFLARDKVSYEQALQMFPDIKVMLFPDIVTTLIGKYHFDFKRDKIFLCCRDDSERFYSKEEMRFLQERLSTLAPVDFGDTQSTLNGKELRRVLEKAIVDEIMKMSRYKVVITDRYHGTILSLCGDTPVIILKTTDHKVTTGAEWFKGIYDGYVYMASDLDDAYRLAEKICNYFEYKHLNPYFDEHYYGKLKDYFEKCSTTALDDVMICK